MTPDLRRLVESSSIETLAWLVENYAGGFGDEARFRYSVVLTPLTDDTYLDEGDEAHALCRVEVAQNLIAGLTAALEAEKRQHDEARARILALLDRLEAQRKLLADARDDVVECLNTALPNAGYARYDRRIADYQQRLAAIDAALKEPKQ